MRKQSAQLLSGIYRDLHDSGNDLRKAISALKKVVEAQRDTVLVAKLKKGLKGS